MKNDRHIGCAKTRSAGAAAGAEQAGGHLAELLDAVRAEGDEAGAPGGRLHPLHTCRTAPPSSEPHPLQPAAAEPQRAEYDVHLLTSARAATRALRSAHHCGMQLSARRSCSRAAGAGRGRRQAGVQAGGAGRAG